ncbi:histidinol-phosphate transaminase [Clostridium malenominatum]|uniref:Histidinol-phosphate transaminase n=1 Tax=Clostridium malenominatum TaxID=1539 RepID=A0ABN1J7A8_9CLOT
MKHGGDIYTEGVLKGKELTDFSSNINPLGVPKSFINNLNEGVLNLTRYPDIQYRELRGNLKEYVNSGEILFNIGDERLNIVEEEDFILGNGAAEIIQLSISLFKSIAIIVPSFGEYDENAEKYGLKITYIPMRNMEYDYDAIERSLKNNDALIIGNPNNPNGGIIDKGKFKTLLDFCEREGKTVIVDEAFIEFTGNMRQSFLYELKSYKCLLIIRALTKFYGMPGIRMGYGISKNGKLLEKMRKSQNPWNINAFAELAAKYVLKDKEYINESLKWIREERKFLVEEMNKVPHIKKAYHTFGNYILCELEEIDGDKLYELCLEKGIVIRKCCNYKGLNNRFIRFAIKDRENNNILLNTLKGIKNI